jgi:hypothetical protein
MEHWPYVRHREKYTGKKLIVQRDMKNEFPPLALQLKFNESVLCSEVGVCKRLVR